MQLLIDGSVLAAVSNTISSHVSYKGTSHYPPIGLHSPRRHAIPGLGNYLVCYSLSAA